MKTRIFLSPFSTIMNNFSSSSSQDYTQLKHQTYKDDLDEVEAIYGGFWQDAECHLQSNNVDRIAASLCKPHNDENEEQDDDIEEEEEDRANGVAENYKQFIDIPVSERERIYIHIFNRDYGLFHKYNFVLRVFHRDSCNFLIVYSTSICQISDVNCNKSAVKPRLTFLLSLKLKDVPEYHLVDTLPKVCEALNLRMKKMNKNG